MTLNRTLRSILFIASVLSAADQTIQHQPPIKVIWRPDLCKEVLQKDAFTLPIKESAPKDPARTAPQILLEEVFQKVDPSRSYMIYAVDYEPITDGATQLIKAKEGWRTYQSDWLKPNWLLDPRKTKHYDELRIFGSAATGSAYCIGNIPMAEIKSSEAKWPERIMNKFDEDILPILKAASVNQGALVLNKRLKAFTSDLGTDDTTTPSGSDKWVDVLKNAQQVLTKASDELLAERGLVGLPETRNEDVKKIAPTFNAFKENPACVNECRDLRNALNEYAHLIIASEWQDLAAGQATSQFKFIDARTSKELKPVPGKAGFYAPEPVLALLNMYLKIDITKKLPTAIENLKAMVPVILPQSSELKSIRIETQLASIAGGHSFTTEVLPNKTEVRLLARKSDEDEPKEYAKQTYLNEKRSRFDFGFAVPLKSQDDVEYDTDAGRLVAKTVARSNVFATVNLYPFAPVDLDKTSLRLLPGFMVGLPISGKILNQQLYAASIGLWRVEAFCGVMLRRNLVPDLASATGTNAALKAQYGARLTFGLQLPIGFVAKKLAK
jgi:hypothetical protein